MNDSQSDPKIGRRDALKILAAVGGSLAASTLLPGKWSIPELQTGVLPVHAQTSRGNLEILSSEESAFNDGDYFVDLSVTIAPAAAGINMRATYEPILPTIHSVSAVETLDAQTNSAGVAEFDRIVIRGDATGVTIQYSFVDIGMCTTNCTLNKNLYFQQVE